MPSVDKEPCKKISHWPASSITPNFRTASVRNSHQESGPRGADCSRLEVGIAIEPALEDDFHAILEQSKVTDQVLTH
jgi:hypothetical protein